MSAMFQLIYGNHLLEYTVSKSKTQNESSIILRDLQLPSNSATSLFTPSCLPVRLSMSEIPHLSAQFPLELRS
jgi:hypothetical protein